MGNFLYVIQTYSDEDNRILRETEIFKKGMIDSFSTIFYMEIMGKMINDSFMEVVFSELNRHEVRKILEVKIKGRFCIRQLNVATIQIEDCEDYLIFRSIAGNRAILMQKRDSDDTWEFVCNLNRFSKNQSIKIVAIDKNVLRDLYCILKLTA